MLISSAAVLLAGEERAFEIKWDGMCALVSVGPAVRVHSRHGYDHTAAFPELAALVQRWRPGQERESAPKSTAATSVSTSSVGGHRRVRTPAVCWPDGRAT
jgi:hypothetical protein